MFILFYICINLWFCIECLTVTMPVDIPLVIFYLYILLLTCLLFISWPVWPGASCKF